MKDFNNSLSFNQSNCSIWGNVHWTETNLGRTIAMLVPFNPQDKRPIKSLCLTEYLRVGLDCIPLGSNLEAKFLKSNILQDVYRCETGKMDRNVIEKELEGKIRSFIACSQKKFSHGPGNGCFNTGFGAKTQGNSPNTRQFGVSIPTQDSFGASEGKSNNFSFGGSTFNQTKIGGIPKTTFGEAAFQFQAPKENTGFQLSSESTNKQKNSAFSQSAINFGQRLKTSPNLAATPFLDDQTQSVFADDASWQSKSSFQTANSCSVKSYEGSENPNNFTFGRKSLVDRAASEMKATPWNYIHPGTKLTNNYLSQGETGLNYANFPNNTHLNHRNKPSNSSFVSHLAKNTGFGCPSGSPQGGSSFQPLGNRNPYNLNPSSWNPYETQPMPKKTKQAYPVTKRPEHQTENAQILTMLFEMNNRLVSLEQNSRKQQKSLEGKLATTEKIVEQMSEKIATQNALIQKMKDTLASVVVVQEETSRLTGKMKMNSDSLLAKMSSVLAQAKSPVKSGNSNFSKPKQGMSSSMNPFGSNQVSGLFKKDKSSDSGEFSPNYSFYKDKSNTPQPNNAEGFGQKPATVARKPKGKVKSKDKSKDSQTEATPFEDKPQGGSIFGTTDNQFSQVKPNSPFSTDQRNNESKQNNPFSPSKTNLVQSNSIFGPIQFFVKKPSFDQETQFKTQPSAKDHFSTPENDCHLNKSACLPNRTGTKTVSQAPKSTGLFRPASSLAFSRPAQPTKQTNNYLLTLS